MVLDFAKAFDKVPHRRLLAKLQYYGIHGKLHCWFEFFLNQRSQRWLTFSTKVGLQDLPL